MKRAGTATLDQIAPLIEELRAHSVLREGRPGHFYLNSREVLHFVEIERAGATHRVRAQAISGPHPKIHELLRAKYGVSDRWVRLVGPDNESTMAVRLDAFEAPQ